MQNYTCFWHPKYGYGSGELTDECDECGRKMDHPLTQLPEQISSYRVTAKISRGFYAVTYVAETNDFLARKVCLKVAPRAVYEMAGKDFEAECRTHLQVASGTRHLVDITGVDQVDVAFGDEAPIPCHVAVLEYVEGSSLEDLLAGEGQLSAKRVAQIALDLLELLRELESRQMNHNDLHAGNILIRQLAPDAVRGGDQIDPTVDTVAVDLGSVQDGSKSGDVAKRLADAHQITDHLVRLARRLHIDPDAADDVDYRLSRALDDIAALLRPEQLAQRSTNYADLQGHIRATFDLATSPWKEVPKGLTRMSDSYNAQTMRSWFIPKLLVDPNGSWQERVEAPGPLVITGMRGCGKTMLLRALQFHARAVVASEESVDATRVLSALHQDGYVGLYASCNRLLDRLGRPDREIHEPISRLFLFYALQALQAIRHLDELTDGTRANPRPIAEVVSELITNADLRGATSAHLMERRIYTMLRSLESGESVYVLSSSPNNAMTALAAAVTQCSRVWDGVSVYFLLDDVSTRHLNENSIATLLSQLMFASDVCAFKITTEAQTLELALKSPGLVERARAGRDYETFDLAQEILNSLRAHSGRAGGDFVTSVLDKRRGLLASHPAHSPAEILGQKNLIDISRDIAYVQSSSPRRKQVYAGVNALAAVCVGDIGDVLSIYQMIIDQAERSGPIAQTPVPETIQSTAFQEHSARLIWRLNRRDGRLKDFADGFAQTAHEELRDSAIRPESQRERLREYSQIYVRVTTGDKARQLRQLRELVDAGVFVLSGAPDAPRIKTRDGDPVTQHILTFRKLLGLSKYVPLGHRDRFELSGDKLEQWLDDPSQCVTILRQSPRSYPTDVFQVGDAASDAESQLVAMANGDLPDAGRVASTSTSDATPQTGDSAHADGDRRSTLRPAHGAHAQPTLFDDVRIDEDEESESVAAAPRSAQTATVSKADWNELRNSGVSGVLGGLGFEARAETSMRRITAELAIAQADLVEYGLAGRTGILEVLDGAVVALIPAARASWTPRPVQQAPFLIDITGLAKPFIYTAVRGQLLQHGEAYIAYTEAEESYPLPDEVERRLEASVDDDMFMRLHRFDDILTGERGEYDFLRVGSGQVDDGRRRMLVAAASAKHERLFTLLDRREYDRVQIMIPTDTGPRSRLAALAAEVAASDYTACEIEKVDTHDLADMVAAVETSYSRRYLEENYNVEVGLTGSKLHAAALAIASADLKFAEAWYLRPEAYDPERFTSGSGQTHLYRVTRRP
ncbi:protein kinase [Cellulomonas sp.]|uniref:ORC-CDC6 family AAA ATPase n=1 Tax=Cellulomonas sp. TaxID=40001 RepID=UPI001B1E2C54|nr:protein kinase [Cellulomonas sp.]MBO9556704.1 protein kinase [Cellulomonas sp.]